MGWRSHIDAGWKPPYVACISKDKNFFGSGLLVASRHVLTALHVVNDDPNRRRDHYTEMARIASIGQPLPPPPPNARFEVSFASSPTQFFNAVCRNFDEINDMALLELDGPVHGVARPRFAEATPGRKIAVEAFGFMGQGDGQTPAFKRQSGEVALNTALKESARDEHYQVSYGAQGGFSGGAVFLAEDGPFPRLIGMSRLGGDAYNHGKIVAAALIRDWLRRELKGEFSLALTTLEEGAAALERGFEPLCCVAPGNDFLFAAINVPDHSEMRQSFVAVAPLTCRTALDTAASLEVAERPAHFATADDVDDVFHRLRSPERPRFRLPTADEILRLTTLDREKKLPGGLLGAPLMIDAFVDRKGAPRPPPDGVLEWCAARSGHEVREHRGSDMKECPAALRPRARIVARLAFDVKVGA